MGFEVVRTIEHINENIYLWQLWFWVIGKSVNGLIINYRRKAIKTHPRVWPIFGESHFVAQKHFLGTIEQFVIEIYAVQ